MRHLLFALALLFVGCDTPVYNKVVIPFDSNGNPFNCYALENTKIFSGEHYVWWVNNFTHQTVEFHGSFLIIRVLDDDWDEALKQVKLTKETCNKLH